MNNSAIWLVNTKPQNKQISPRRTCKPVGYKTKISSRYHGLLIYDVKRTRNIDGMVPFKAQGYFRSVFICPNPYSFKRP